MKTEQANLLNSLTLISLGLWGYFDVSSPTALIPVFFGIVLFLCNSGVKNDNKVIAHVGPRNFCQSHFLEEVSHCLFRKDL